MSENWIRSAVDGLFRNGFGEEASRLVLTSADGRDLGGWCKQAIVDQLESAFRLAAPSKPRQEEADGR